MSLTARAAKDGYRDAVIEDGTRLPMRLVYSCFACQTFQGIL